MYDENDESGEPNSEDLYFNDEAEAAYANPDDNVFGAGHRAPELDKGAFQGDHSVPGASSIDELHRPLKFLKWNCPKRRLFIALGAGILIVVVIVIIVLAATGCFRHGKSKPSKFSSLCSKLNCLE